MIFSTPESAYDWFLREYCKKFNKRIQRIYFVNHGRHKVMFLDDKETGERECFYCLFKKDSIWSFEEYAKDLLKEFPDLAGRGESINFEYFNYAKMQNASLIYIYENGEVYQISTKAISKCSIIHNQTQKNTYIETNQIITKNEQEYWFPFKLMNKVGL